MNSTPNASDTTRNRSSHVKLILSKSRIPAIRKLTVEPDSDRIVLCGRLPLFYYKQLAQELVRSEFPETVIVNRIEVLDLD